MTTPPCHCYQIGVDNINAILNRAAARSFGPDFFEIRQIYNTLKCNLPEDIWDLLWVNINNIVSETSNVTSQVNLLYIVTIFVTLLLLIIFIYLTIYFNNNTATLIFFILSFITLIMGALVLYFGLNSIYNTSGSLITTQLTHIRDVLQNAVDKAICCSGDCGPCAHIVTGACPIT